MLKTYAADELPCKFTQIYTSHRSMLIQIIYLALFNIVHLPLQANYDTLSLTKKIMII